MEEFPIKLKIICNTDTNKEMIPPLLIQTFIENSIKHNIMMIRDLEITLLIEEAGDFLAIRIKDNGLGFPAETLDKLSRDEDIEEDGKHIGIVNVKNRLQVLYGDRARVTIQNDLEGSHAAICIPRIHKDENTKI